MMFQIALLASLCFTTNAFVNYGDAALYDEYDLSLYKSFPLAECLAASCKVYVSAPEESLPTLEKIYLGDTTLAALARVSNATTGLKTPYNLKAYSGKNFITNFNWKFATAPVAVYIVYQRATFYSTALVYEPTSAPLTVHWTNSSTLTILSATNFSVKGAVAEGSLAHGRVIAGGYDVATRNWAKTPALYEFSVNPSFDFSVNGPLATLYAFKSVEAQLTIERGLKSDTTSSRTFITSPGYTGAISGQVYRSSLYNKSVQFRVSYEKETTIHFKAFLNTFADSVEVTVDGGANTSIRGTRGLTSYHQFFSARGKDLVITFTKSSDLSSFLLRIASEIVLDELKEKIADKVEEIKEKIGEKVDEIKDQVKQKVHEKVDEIKDQVKEKIEGKIDEVKEEVREKIDEKVEEVKDAVKEKIAEKVEDEANEVEEKIEEAKEEVQEKITDIKQKIGDALSKITAEPDLSSETIDEIKDALKEELEEKVEGKVEEVDEKIEEAQKEIEDTIEDIRSKVSARPDRSTEVEEIKDALKQKLEDRLGKITALPHRNHH